MVLKYNLFTWIDWIDSELFYVTRVGSYMSTSPTELDFI